VLKNNIFYKNDFVDWDGRWDDWAEFDGSPVQVWTRRMSGYFFTGNNIFNNTPGEERVIGHGDGPTYHALSWWESNHPELFSGNVEADPGFVNPEGHDFSLRPGSAMIDAGDFLTRAVGAGSGTTIEVEDASYFFDGFGITGQRGDLIQLEGQSQKARIASVDYGANRIMLDSPLTWHHGQQVSLAFKGAAPDIGAIEY